jgi:hypothetical protein
VKRFRYQQAVLPRGWPSGTTGAFHVHPPCPASPIYHRGALIVAGIFNTVAFSVWPWGRDGTEAAFVQAVTGSSSAGEIGPLLLHYGFVALAAGLLGLLEMLRSGPAAWGHIAGVLAFVGVVSFLPSAQIFWLLRAADAVGFPPDSLPPLPEPIRAGWRTGPLFSRLCMSRSWRCLSSCWPCGAAACCPGGRLQ